MASTIENQTIYRLICEANASGAVRSTPETGKDGVRHIKLSGPFIIADKLNKNHRMYKFDELRPEVDKFIENDVKSGHAFGDFEHPEDGKILRDRAAVKINELVLDEPNKQWNGVAIVMASDPVHGITGTPRGDLLKSYLDYGTPVGFSTRGFGVIDPNDEYVKQYQLVTIDAVCDPSIGKFCEECCEGVVANKAFMKDVHGMIVECAYDRFDKLVDESARTYDAELKRKILSNALKQFSEDIGK